MKSTEQQRGAFNERPTNELTLRAIDLEELGLSVVFINSDRKDEIERARKNALLIRDAIELDRQGRGEAVALTTMQRQMIRNVIHEVGQRSRCKGDYHDQVADLLTVIASAPQPADPTIKESLTVAEPVKEVSVPDGLWQQAYDKAWSVAHLYPTGAGMLYWLEAEHKRLVASTAPAYWQAQQDADMVTCACGDMHPATSYGAGFIDAAGMCENCHAAACVAPMSDKTACGVQNAECAPQTGFKTVTCPICSEDEPHTGTCGSSDPRALCNKAAKPAPAMAGDDRAEFEAAYIDHGGLRLEDYELDYEPITNRYLDDNEQSAWWAWQESRKRVQQASGEDANA